MQLLARFFLNRAGIGFQILDLAGIAVVFVLQRVDFLLQAMVVSAFFAVDDHAVGPESYMHEQPHGDDAYGGCGQSAAGTVKQGQIWAQLFEDALSESFRLRSAFDQRTKALLGSSKDADFWNLFYSKIHFLAAALSFSSASLLLASEYTRTTGSVPETR